MVEKEIGFVGEVTGVNPQLIKTLVAGDTIPVIATVASGEGGQALNINADTAAGEVRRGNINVLPCLLACLRRTSFD